MQTHSTPSPAIASVELAVTDPQSAPFDARPLFPAARSLAALNPGMSSRRALALEQASRILRERRLAAREDAIFTKRDAERQAAMAALHSSHQSSFVLVPDLILEETFA